MITVPFVAFWSCSILAYVVATLAYHQYLRTIGYLPGSVDAFQTWIRNLGVVMLLAFVVGCVAEVV